MEVPDVIARAPDHRRRGAPVVATISRRHDRPDTRLARQHAPQLHIVVLGRQAHGGSAIGEQTDSAIEVAHVRQAIDDEEEAQGNQWSIWCGAETSPPADATLCCTANWRTGSPLYRSMSNALPRSRVVQYWM